MIYWPLVALTWHIGIQHRQHWIFSAVKCSSCTCFALEHETHETFKAKVKYFEMEKRRGHVSAFFPPERRRPRRVWVGRSGRVTERSLRERRSETARKREVVFSRTTEKWRGRWKSHSDAHKSNSPLDVFSSHCSSGALERVERVVWGKVMHFHSVTRI